MKFILSNVSILNQEPGIIGMCKHIERVGRICYKSADKITDDSYKNFVKMIYTNGHHNVLSLGTVYLKFNVNNLTREEFDTYLDLKSTIPYTKFTRIDNICYLTTNFRIICLLKAVDFMKKYWSEPEENHYHRITADFNCSIGIAIEILRHRAFCHSMESTRYVNYSKDKFGNELTYIIPQWIYKLRDHLINKDCFLKYLNDLDGVSLWHELVVLSDIVKRRNNLYKLVEDEYMFETLENEEFKLKAEDSRGMLPKDIKCELCSCGYIKDWLYENPTPETNPEKAGFFYLRSAPTAHPDIRILSDSLKEQFIENKLDKLK